MVVKKIEVHKTVKNEVEILPTTSKIDHNVWFEDNIQQYKTLAAMVAATLKSTLDAENISYVDIPFREKNKSSFLKKIENKNKFRKYIPEKMTDLAGIRVITLIESDVEKVGNIIEELFHVHPEDSINKSESLGDDKVGYRSVHYVCDIGNHRENLREWKNLKNLCFEIQVRTALEHAWAEIEHDRGYKLGGKLPSHLIRRFSLLSALLESADLEFNRLTVEIEKYTDSVNQDIKEDKQLNVEITTIGIIALMKHIFPYMENILDNDEYLSKAIKDIYNLGIENLSDLKKIIYNVKDHISPNSGRGYLGILRTALLYDNLEAYMDKAWNRSEDKWNDIPQDVVDMLSQKYTQINLPEFFNNYGISIY